MEAIQRSRKSGMWRGPKPEAERVGVTACSAGPVLGVRTALWVDLVYGVHCGGWGV